MKHKHEWIFRKWCNACACGEMLIKVYVKFGVEKEVYYASSSPVYEIYVKYEE